MTKHGMDLLIISPGNHRAIYQDLAKDYTAVEPPVWAGLLANAVRTQGYGVAILDQEAEGLTVDQVAAQAMESSPRLTAVVVYGHQPSASTQNMTGAQAVCSRLREAAPHLKTILIGGHPSALPERSLSDSQADFVCQGEGPYTLDGLLHLPDLGDPTCYSKVPGLWYRENGIPVFTHPAPVVPEQDLNRVLPGAAWDLLPMGRYRAHNWHCFAGLGERSPYAALYTSLGCPYRCSFCCINAPFGKAGIRYWDPDRVIQELDLLAGAYGVRNIKLADEMFFLNPRRVETLCDRIIERGHDFNIWAYARVDTVDERLLDKMKRAGFHWLGLGIESRSRFVRDGVRKGHYEAEEIHAVVRQIQSAGIFVMGNFIFGLPDDDRRSMQETLDMAVELDCEMVNFYAAMAYPGSPLYEMAQQQGWRLPERWDHYSQHAYETLPLPTKHLSAEEVLRFRDEAWLTYFTRPGYLDRVSKTFGPDVVDHFKTLTGIRLKRRLLNT